MICIVRNKSKFYKKVLLDVWGQHFKYNKITKLVHYRRIMKEQWKARKRFYSRTFVYSLARKISFRRKKRLKKKYIKPKVLYNYYLTLRRRTYKKYMFKAKRQLGSFYRNYLTFVEGRLFMLVYRSNFVTNMFKLKFIIDRGIFLVNGQRKYYANFNVRVGEIVQVDFKYKELIAADMRLRFKTDVINWLPKNYLFINYKFMFIFFLKSPKGKDFKGFPIKLDPYVGGDIYFL